MAGRSKRARSARGTRRGGGGAPMPPLRRDAEGRAHLVLHRDAQGRPQRLGLSQPVFQEQWQNDVAVAAATTAHAMLSDGRTLEQVIALARNALGGASRLAEGLLAQTPDHQLACAAGCSHCCHQAVGVSAPEVLAIFESLQTTRTPAELEDLSERIRRADDRTRGLSFAERLSPELPCPLLEEGRCSVYEVRPLACRGQNSLDAAGCSRSLRDAEGRAEFLAGSYAVPCYLEPVRAAHAVMAGLQLGLQELHGLRMLPLELTAALRILLDRPAEVVQAWLAGGDPFAEARGGDATGDPRIEALSGRLPRT